MMPLYVIGAGGHAKVVVATAEACGWPIAGVLDDDPTRWGRDVLGHVVGGPSTGVLDDARALCVIAIGDNAVRRRLAAGARCEFATLVHPRAVVHASVVLGPGTVVFAGAVIQPDARVGSHAIVNTGASIDHDSTLGIAVHIAPGARVAGSVTIGDETLVGIGACVIPGIRIGAGAVVGAGATVVRDVLDGNVVVGVPAQVR